MCVVIFSTKFVGNIFVIEEISEKWSKMFIGSHVQCLLFLSDCNETWIFWTDFWKILKYYTS